MNQQLSLLAAILYILASPLLLAATPAISPSPSPSMLTGPNKTEGLLNRLLAPGPLMIGHSNLEQTECLKCHTLQKGVPDEKCNACHKEIRLQVMQKSGFHGLTKKACVACHKEHKGRQYDSTQIDSKTFDHKQTGYRLAGKHALIKCAECHLEKRANAKKALRPNELRYFGLTTKCVTCHKKRDIHHFTGTYATKDCDTCHGLKSWKKDLHFDHERQGKFKLQGKHAQIACAKCHNKDPKLAVYKWPELNTARCLTCHKDPHKDNLSPKFRGGDCSKCHADTTWKIKNFDHNLANYPLRGKHARIKCLDCHKQTREALAKGPRAIKWTGLKKECLSCHRSPHLKSFSPITLAKQCTDCHTENGWTTLLLSKSPETPGFRHDQETRFALKGRHAELQCSKCHGSKPKLNYRFAHPEKDFCVDCHKNVHIGQFSATFAEKKCSECHTQTDFTRRNEFNHSTTAMPLTGKHLKTDCAKCHVPTQELMDAYPSKNQKPRKFKSRYLYRETASRAFCISCHKNVHEDQFHKLYAEKACSFCHTTENFTSRLPFDHSATNYPLRGKHAPPLKCEKCHIPTQEFFRAPPQGRANSKSLFIFPELTSKNCATCHKDPHKSTFGTKCFECHNENFWKKTKDFHRDFTLSGIHYSLECAECHKNGQQLMGMSENCMLCHQKDDIHHGALPVCKDCHRQQFWENPEFKHSLSRFPLRGVHRTLECNSCHRNGIYKGTPSRCPDCHMQDALKAAAAGIAPHSGDPALAQDDCFRCHNQFSFR